MRAAWLSGEKVDKLIGFDATEDHRTYATGGGVEVAADPALPPYRQRYNMRYLLREWGLTREDCGRIIVNAGLPLPPKSACFFCPAMKEAEIAQLAVDDPDSHLLALEMERLYRAGRHFRGDNRFTVRAVHKTTGEVETLEVFASSRAEAVAQFRLRYRDTTRPHRYKTSAHSSVVGLGRNFTWTGLSLPVLEG